MWARPLAQARALGTLVQSHIIVHDEIRMAMLLEISSTSSLPSTTMGSLEVDLVLDKTHHVC